MADLTGTLTGVFDRAGCLGWVHATTLDGSREVALGADDLVTPASVVKVLIALEAATRMADGRLDPSEPVTLTERTRTPGPVGLSFFADDATISLQDLVTLMLTLSDNVSTDVLLDRIGVDAVNDTARRLGMTRTHLPCDLRTMLDEIAAAAGFTSYAELEAFPISDPERIAEILRRQQESPALDPQHGMRTTPRDQTELLRSIWRDEAGPPDACERVRRTMRLQLTKNRIASGFARGYQVAVKSGGLMGVVRNEAGVVTAPDQSAYAVAVFTRTDCEADGRPVDAAIGEAAALAVEALGTSSGS